MTYEVISHLCKDKSITISRLCEDIGIYRSAISDLKHTRTKELSIKVLCMIADYFHVTIDQLLGRAPLQEERKEGKSVKKDTSERLEECLLVFVERVAKGGATTEAEVQVLPAVAQVLASLRIG